MTYQELCAEVKENTRRRKGRDVQEAVESFAVELSRLARTAGLNHKYLAVKLSRGTPITKDESALILKALGEYGIKLTNGGKR